MAPLQTHVPVRNSWSARLALPALSAALALAASTGLAGPAAASPATNAYLDSVSCVSSSSCTAAGFELASSSLSGLVARMSGVGHWQTSSVLTGPAKAAPGGLLAISCTALAGCTALPSASPATDSHHQTAVAVEASSAWSWKEVPVPAKAKTAELSATSCHKTYCQAVGSYTTGPGTAFALSEADNAGKWSQVPVPSLKGAIDPSLSSVSCPAVGTCTAVGTFFQGNFVAPLVEKLSAGKWRGQMGASVSSTVGTYLRGISCPTTSWCAAVGYDTTGKAVVETSLMGGWAMQSFPSPAQAESTQLTSVSCTTSKACVAVGHYATNEAHEVAVSYVLKAGKWQLATVPSPVATANAQLLGVSCHSASACESVGYYTLSGGKTAALAESWNGTKWAAGAM